MLIDSHLPKLVCGAIKPIFSWFDDEAPAAVEPLCVFPRKASTECNKSKIELIESNKFIVFILIQQCDDSSGNNQFVRQLFFQ